MNGDIMRKLPFIACFSFLLGNTKVPDNRNRAINKTYTHNDMDSMLREMTGKSKAEKAKIIKKYGRM